MVTTLEEAQKVLAAQPFSVLLGTELIEYGSGAAALRLRVRDELGQQNGVVHGGVLSYLADNAMAFAGGSALGPAVFTSEFKINYIRPAAGDTLVARAQVMYAGKTQAVVRCDVVSWTGDEQATCVAAQGTIASRGGP